MNSNEFHELVHLVIESKVNPPITLFAGGFDNWRVRARLAHFLILPEFMKIDEAVELFRSVVDVTINKEVSEDIEEKLYALQNLSVVLRDMKKFDEALHYINMAIELAEDTDFLYKYILRGELWCDRWNILARQKKTAQASEEVTDKIKAYGHLPIKHISYLYYGYRFLAQVSGANYHKEDAIALMKKALNYMDVPEKNKKMIDAAMNIKHDNISWILQQIDLATPIPSSVQWDI